MSDQIRSFWQGYSGYSGYSCSKTPVGEKALKSFNSLGDFRKGCIRSSQCIPPETASREGSA